MIQVADVRPELLVPDEQGGHVWVMVAAFKVSDAEIREHAEAGTEIDLESDRMTWAQVVCMVCERPWTRATSGQPCPDEMPV